jgi:hypothetical protein
MTTVKDMIEESRRLQDELTARGETMEFLTEPESPEIDSPQVSESSEEREQFTVKETEVQQDELTSEPMTDVPVVGQNNPDLVGEMSEPEIKTESLTDVEPGDAQLETRAIEEVDYELQSSELTEEESPQITTGEMEDVSIEEPQSIQGNVAEDEPFQQTTRSEPTVYEDVSVGQVSFSDIDAPALASQSITDVSIEDLESPDQSEPEPTELSSVDEPIVEADRVDSRGLSDLPEMDLLFSAEQRQESYDITAPSMNDVPQVTLDSGSLDATDPQTQYNEASERQYDFALRMNTDFASQIAEQLSPQFDEMRMNQTQITQDYVDSQMLLMSSLRDGG